MTGQARATFIVGDDDVGRRLDQVLAARIPELSRTQARVLIDIGGVFVGGRRLKMAGRPMRAGEEVVAVMGGAFSRATKRPGREARAGDESRLPPHTIVFEDQDLVVVEKPAGLLTAPTPESDRNNLAMLLSRRQPPGPEPGIFVVHRIDLETSGLVVFAKTPHANRVLSEKFRTHDIDRAYLAVVGGAFPDGVTRIDRPVGGRPAVTHLAIRERLGTLATLLECRLETGRTHQIRLHAVALGHPVIGDAKYGVPFRTVPAPRMALHATTLGFAHPTSGAALSFASPMPADLFEWLTRLRRASAPDTDAGHEP